MKTTKKNNSTLVEDIYNTIGVIAKGKELKISDDTLETFGVEMAAALKHWATPQKISNEVKPGLRMSNIGKPDRQLWYDINSKDKTVKELHPSMYIKFLYGHLLEVLMLTFVKMAGHEVDHEQKEVTVKGIKGHMDCTINGEVVDVKTASGFAFKKFNEGTLAEDDGFGYLAQLAGYEEAMKTEEGGFLVMNKESGEIVFFKPDDFDKPNIKNRIDTIKKITKSSTAPDFCYKPIAEGKSGNMKLPRQCNWCPYKFECHKEANDGAGLRIFKYAKGNAYLTTVVKEPNVEEVLI